MSKAAALYQFWSSFGLPAYDEISVPTGDLAPKFPYITYEVATDSFTHELALTGSVWYRSTSWVEPNAKAEEISKRIGMGGIIVPFDGGAMLIRRGSPFAQSMGDSYGGSVVANQDNMIKRKYINITVEFLTVD